MTERTEYIPNVRMIERESDITGRPVYEILEDIKRINAEMDAQIDNLNRILDT